MTFWEIADLVEKRKPVLCNCGYALFVSRVAAPKGYIRMRCHYCDTDVLLAKWVVDWIVSELDKRGGVGEL